MNRSGLGTAFLLKKERGSKRPAFNANGSTDGCLESANHGRARQGIVGYVQRIDPERAIAAAAQEVHGIAYTELVGMPKWADVAPIVVDRLKSTDLAIAHNMDFDGPFIGLELVRVGQPVPTFDTFCTMKNGRWAAFDGKSPKCASVAMDDKALSQASSIMKHARLAGWDENGDEGAWEFCTRMAYDAGWTDCKERAAPIPTATEESKGEKQS